MSSTTSSSLASYLPTLLLIPVGYVLWKFSSPPPAAASGASSSSTTSSSTMTDDGQSSRSSKKKKKAAKATSAAAPAAAQVQPKAPAQAPESLEKPKPAPKPAAAQAASVDAPSSAAEVVKKGKKKSNKLKALAAEDKSKPLAEVHAEREAGRLGTSGVEDMLPPVLPPARVMKISSSTTYEEPNKAPSPLSTSSSSEDESEARLATVSQAAPLVDEFNDGWGQAPAAEDEQWETIPVKGKAKKPLGNPLLSASSSPSAAATAAAASAASAKKARQNAARAEAKKAAKQDSEAERLRALAAHKKRLEQARIEEIYKKGRGGGSKAVGGGMTASVSSTGKLEWD